MAKSAVHFSNRVEIPQPGKASAGGLDVSLSCPPADVLITRIGWSGNTVPDSEFDPINAITEATKGRIRYIVTDLPESEKQGAYDAVANGALWPLKHYRKDIYDLGGLKTSDLALYYSYNNRITTLGERYLRSDDVAIVHDYHLEPMGECLIARGINNPIGHFAHTPEIDADLTEELNSDDQNIIYELMKKRFAYDLAGLQARRDFVAVESILGDSPGNDAPSFYQTRLIPDPNKTFNRNTHFGVFPVIGDVVQDVKTAEDWANRAEVTDFLKKIGLKEGDFQIIGADRLDYSKGLPNRFTALGICHRDGTLDSSTGHFLQLAPFGRENVLAYQIERAKTEQAYDTLNSIFRDAATLYQGKYVRSVGLALFRKAKIGLITPLRDGANLVAAEYIAAQDPKNPGVLVLSKFAGIAERLTKGAVLVDPRRPEDIARGIRNAYFMGLEERQALHESAMKALLTYTNADWQQALIGGTEAAARQRPIPSVRVQPMQVA